jgi:hypothetical protein
MVDAGDIVIGEPLAGPTPDTFDEDHFAPAELILDVLVAHEFGAGSPAAKLMWDAVEWPMPTKVTVTPQVKRTDGRTTDVQVEGDNRRLLCEDKLADGVFQRGQLASYLKEVRELAPLEDAVR